MKHMTALPRWAKIAGLATSVGALVGLVAFIAQKVRGSEFRLTPDEIRQAVGSRKDFEETWQRLMDNR